MSKLKEQIVNDMVEAMKAKNQDKLRVLRSIKTAFQEKEISERKDGVSNLSEEQYLAVLTKAAKQRKDSITQFVDGDREDLAEIERKELEIIEAYLPEMMSEDEVRKNVQDKIQQLGASGLQDMGKVMGQLMAQLRGKADGALISKLVKEELSK